MNHSFYHFVLKYRGGPKGDMKAVFAESMFKDHGFPKYEESFDPLSKYIEEIADPQMPASVFDDLWKEYDDLRSLG
ncbi:YozE family protein [Chungangia koreensis]|uniref:YozE family protein n=1 Tax=Chungangia koreensis TaxID=752657 RepID=A0ABV8X5V3_9LACT